jgi:hypothetical protein
MARCGIAAGEPSSADGEQPPLLYRSSNPKSRPSITFIASLASLPTMTVMIKSL